MSPIFRKTIGLIDSFTYLQQFQVFKMASFEFKVTLHHGLWGEKHPVMMP